MRKFEIGKDTMAKPFDRHWQFCTGSGHAKMAMRADYGKQLRMVQKDLGIRRVRFHGIFCDDMDTYHTFSDIFPIPVSIPEGQEITEMSFRSIAVAYDNVLAAGMQPFVELSFMPKHLAGEDVSGVFYYRPNVCMPKDDRKWTDYITAFVKFLLNRYGTAEVEEWYFEVWNEPDLQVPFFHGSQEDYFHLYEITARAVKAADGHIRVGGPSTSGSKWTAAFIRYCREHDVPVDFVSTHQYAGDPLGGVSDQESEQPDAGLEANESSPENRMQQAAGLLQTAPKDSILPAFRMLMRDPLEDRDMPDNVFRTNAPVVKRQAGGLPVYYTEWNCSATFGSASNDTRKVAAYDVKTALALEHVIDGSSIWSFSDIFEEMHPFPEEFHGGFGMLTQSGIKKPVYYALQMLADVGDERLVLPEDYLDGEIGMAAFRGKGGLQLLLMRQKMRNRFDLPKEEAEVCIACDRKPSEVQIMRIDEDHCNPLKIWESIGSPQVPTPAQVQDIQENSAMKAESIPYEFENGVLSIHTELGVNDLCLISIK